MKVTLGYTRALKKITNCRNISKGKDVVRVREKKHGGSWLDSGWVREKVKLLRGMGRRNQEHCRRKVLGQEGNGRQKRRRKILLKRYGSQPGGFCAESGGMDAT